MNNAQKYIEKVRTFLKARDDRDSDYYIAQKLGVTRGAIYNWKTGRSGIDIREGYKVAILLGEDTLKVVSELQQDEFKNPETREVFKQALDLIKDSESAA